MVRGGRWVAPAGWQTSPVSSEDTAPATPQDSPFEPDGNSRDQEEQFVLPLVVRLEKTAPPDRTDALEAAARAVLVLLDDARARGAGEWAEAVRRWQDARIRKVVRRARGAGWRKARALPGITVTQGSAEVRVFPPVPLDGWPKELAVLQVSGTELDPAATPPVPDPSTPVLWLNPGITMSAGKAMAQAGHAAQLAWWELDEAERAQWRERGFALAVREASAARWRELAGAGLPLVRDAGFTEVAPGSATVVADLPVLRGRGEPQM